MTFFIRISQMICALSRTSYTAYKKKERKKERKKKEESKCDSGLLIIRIDKCRSLHTVYNYDLIIEML